MTNANAKPSHGRVVAGATPGAGRGIAPALREAGATVICTGRTTKNKRSAYSRPETVEETAELVAAGRNSACSASCSGPSIWLLLEQTEQGKAARQNCR